MKGRALSEIQSVQNQSTVWSDILRQRDETTKVMKCNVNYSAIQYGKGIGLSLSNINEALQILAEIDQLEDGIWYGKSSKMAILLWRLRWNMLPTFSRIREWGETCPDKCVLCEEVDETPDHLFINCVCQEALVGIYEDGGKHTLEGVGTTNPDIERLVIGQHHRGDPKIIEEESGTRGDYTGEGVRFCSVCLVSMG